MSNRKASIQKREEFATWLRTERIRNGYRQKDLAELVGCCWLSINNYENRRSYPLDPIRTKLVRVLQSDEPAGDPMHWYLPPANPSRLCCGKCKRTATLDKRAVLATGNGWPKYCPWCGARMLPPVMEGVPDDKGRG